MRVLAILGIVALAVFSTRLTGDEAKKTPASGVGGLIGSYVIVSGEKEGEKLDAERLKDVAVQIAANAITTFDKDKKQVYAATYEIDANRKPWRITMTATITPVDGKGTKAEGLIMAEGDTVKLIYALPGGKAPTEFKTGARQQMFVMKKAPPRS